MRLPASPTAAQIELAVHDTAFASATSAPAGSGKTLVVQLTPSKTSVRTWLWAWPTAAQNVSVTQDTETRALLILGPGVVHGIVDSVQVGVLAPAGVHTATMAATAHAMTDRPRGT